jgi:hypothetical protein
MDKEEMMYVEGGKTWTEASDPRYDMGYVLQAYGLSVLFSSASAAASILLAKAATIGKLLLSYGSGLVAIIGITWAVANILAAASNLKQYGYYIVNDCYFKFFGCSIKYASYVSL